MLSVSTEILMKRESQVYNDVINSKIINVIIKMTGYVKLKES